MKKTEFKPGDKVRCIDTTGLSNDALELQKEYVIRTVDKTDYGYDMLFIEGMSDVYDRFFSTRFELVESPSNVPTTINIAELNEKLQKAKSLIGKRVRYQSIIGVATSCELFCDPKTISSFNVGNKIKKDGYCVAIRYGEHQIVPVDDLEEDISKEFVLNEDYTAIVSKEAVKVGCQTFDSKVILEMAEYIKTL